MVIVKVMFSVMLIVVAMVLRRSDHGGSVCHEHSLSNGSLFGAQIKHIYFIYIILKHKASKHDIIQHAYVVVQFYSFPLLQTR